MIILVKTLQLLFSLSILVLIHELGHFLFARLFKTRVEKFYLFFNPWFSLFKIKRGETTYGIGWLPLGGYCKIAGMIDESLDREALKKEPQPWEFRSKKAYQRFLIMFGGVLFNFIFALAIYSTILMVWGDQYLSMKETKQGIYCDSLALSVGLKNGDFIEKVGHHDVEKFNDVMMFLLVENENVMTVRRGDSVFTLPVPERVKKQLITTGGQAFIAPFLPFYVDSVVPGGSASRAGIHKGDHVLSINGIQTPCFYDFVREVHQLKGKPAELELSRNGDTMRIPLVVSNEGIIGVTVMPYDKIYNLTQIRYTFLSSIPAGIALGVETLGSYVKQLRLIFTAEGAQQIGGFGTIGSLFPSVWDWEMFWRMTAFLSIVLAFMNVLPIPALDGGHIAFLVYEMVSGRKPGDKFLEKAQIFGMLLLFTLLVYANANDLMRLLFGK